MDKDLASGSLGTEAKWDVSFAGGKLIASIAYSGSLAGANIGISIGAKQVLDALALAIPGKIDDAVIAVIEQALGL